MTYDLSDHAALDEHQASALDVYTRGIRGVAQELFNQSQPTRRGR